MIEPVSVSEADQFQYDRPFAEIQALFTQPNDALSKRINQGITRFFNDTDDQAPFNKDSLIKKYSLFEIPLEGQTFDDYLDYLEHQIIPDSAHLASPRFLGHMTSPLPRFIPEIGRLIQSLNQNMVKMETSRGLTMLERQTLGLIHKELFDLEPSFYEACVNDFTTTLGIFTSGGTLANISALWAACRQAASYEQATKVSSRVVIGSELMHYSFDKAAEIFGLELIKLPVNHENSIDIEVMTQMVQKCAALDKQVIALVGIAGTTDFGSIDPLADICRLGQQHHIYVHIDAAWGGGFVLSEYKNSVLGGAAQADSITIDGHKQLMMPIGCGLLLFRNPKLSQKIAHHAPYAVREKSLDQGKYTLEGTRPANALYLHACLSILGRKGYHQIFQRAMENTEFMAQQIKDSEAFELISEPKINILTYRYIPRAYRGRELTEQDNVEINGFNEALQKMQRARGRSFISRTTRAVAQYGPQKLTLLRAVLLNPLSDRDDIQYVLDDQLSIASVLEAQQ
ncbi:aminotransferase class V-fold PLP-dependent enzyme [Neisseriaceae bacterium CLB008]